jgi:hypothetical protein
MRLGFVFLHMTTVQAVASAFEATIAVLTHCAASLPSIPSIAEGSDRKELSKPANLIESTPCHPVDRIWLRWISHQCHSAISADLLVGLDVSVATNFGRVMDFGRDPVAPTRGRYCGCGRSTSQSNNSILR